MATGVTCQRICTRSATSSSSAATRAMRSRLLVASSSIVDRLVLGVFWRSAQLAGNTLKASLGPAQVDERICTADETAHRTGPAAGLPRSHPADEWPLARQSGPRRGLVHRRRRRGTGGELP